MGVIVYYRQAITGGASNALDGIDSSILNNNDLCIVAASDSFYLYKLNSTSGAVESSPDIIEPDDSAAGDKRWILQRQPVNGTMPEGSIVAWVPGYFTAAANGGTFTPVLCGNTIAEVNTFLNADGWHVCNGAALNLGTSTIFNGAGRYLPDLTDNRYIQGGGASLHDTVGTIGGVASNVHTHSHYHGLNSHVHSLNSHVHSMQSHTHMTKDHTLTATEMPSHSHDVRFTPTTAGAGSYDCVDYLEYVPNKNAVTGTGATSSAGSSGPHNHAETYGPDYTNTGASSGNTGTCTTNTATDATAASTNENRPEFLACYYIMKVIA